MRKYLKQIPINNPLTVIIALSISLFFACQFITKSNKYTLDGITQGSYYHIIYFATSTQNQNIKEDINKLLTQIDCSVSLWNENSLINQINNNHNPNLDTIFIDCFNRSQEISELTGGYLDCTTGELVEKHGFASKEKQPLTQKTIDSLLQYAGYKKVRIENRKLHKDYPQTKIDLNAIAQGYTTDRISRLLISRGITNFIVDIGGEVRANGSKEMGKKWLCGIEQPSLDSNSERSYKSYLELQNQSVVTSGSYRKYYTDSLGNRHSHAIDPFTGKSAEHNLLSVSVVDTSATFCDGLATALLVMGVEKSKTFLQNHPNLKVHLIYFENNQYKTYTTPNLKLHHTTP